MRIGILTGGGDAPGTNAVIRAVTRSLIHRHAAEIIGIEDGYLGLIERRVRPLDWRAVSGIVAQGGTMLGTTNRVSPLQHEGRDRRAEVLAYARELRLDGVVAIGGDGTMAIADALHREGLPTVGVPKTIDNDIAGVERSFGFDTAVARATEALDRVQTTGQSHGRVMLVETMGRHAGWIALEAGIASGADLILLPELAFELDAIVRVCQAREAAQRFTVICVAEGAHAQGAATVVRQRVEGSPEPERLGGISEWLVAQLQPRLKSEVRAVVLGHVQRGGAPTASDRVLATRYGAAAADLVGRGGWGRMVTLCQGQLAHVALADVAGRNRHVPLDHPLLDCVRQMGVSLGVD
ncbi:MAG: ATP-dependent 6-phosphofructokinase [Pseudomonadota bacterium]